MKEYIEFCFCFSSPTERRSCTFRAAILALSSGQAGRVCAFGSQGGWRRVGESGGRPGRVGCQNWLDGTSRHRPERITLKD